VSTLDDIHWMKQAIEMAQKALIIDEVPVGAVIVKDNKVIGSGYNQVISTNDATAHAEIQAIRSAGHDISNYRVIESTLYVTMEPCMMCVGAIVHARIDRIVFGAYDHKTGMALTRDSCFDKPYHNHKVRVFGGVLELNCASLLKDFFRMKRQQQKHDKI
jgi:tRNA(adenine34) deaminase